MWVGINYSIQPDQTWGLNKNEFRNEKQGRETK